MEKSTGSEEINNEKEFLNSNSCPNKQTKGMGKRFKYLKYI